MHPGAHIWPGVVTVRRGVRQQAQEGMRRHGEQQCQHADTEFQAVSFRGFIAHALEYGSY